MTTQELTEEQQRVHGYLMSQGEKYSWLELWPKVLSVRLQLIDALDGLSAEQAEARTSADEWTIMEGMRHEIAVTRGTLHHVERLAGVAISDAAEERDPAEQPFEELRRDQQFAQDEDRPAFAQDLAGLGDRGGGFRMSGACLKRTK